MFLDMAKIMTTIITDSLEVDCIPVNLLTILIAGVKNDKEPGKEVILSLDSSSNGVISSQPLRHVDEGIKIKGLYCSHELTRIKALD